MKKYLITSNSSPLARGVRRGTPGGVARKLIFAITLALCTFAAYAENENAATSKEYVDTELATKQPTIPAAGNNMVMTFDSNATDGIGTKQIYDESASYAEQQDALVTAGTANAAVQMAINGEFICTEYSTIDPTDCWLWGIKSEYYAKYDLIDIIGYRDKILFNNNYGNQITFDPNTKIATISIRSGYERANVLFGLNSSRNIYQPTHKYYWRAKIRKTDDGVIVSIFRDTIARVAISATTEWRIHDAVFEATDFNPDQYHYPVIEAQYTDANGGQGIQIDQNEYSIFDLTEIFGAGNEPATADAAAKALGLLYIP